MQDYLFAKLPIALIKCGLLAELKPASVVVYCVLLSYADFNTGRCFPGIQTICDLSGLSRQTVAKSIKELEDWGLVQVTRRQGSHNVYQLSLPRTTANNKNQINRTNVVNRTESSKDSATSQRAMRSTTPSSAKKFVYQLRIADIQQQP